jgi:hypothetical protein
VQGDEHQISPGAEILALIPDHKPFELGLQTGERCLDHSTDILIQGIHLRVEFDAPDSITKIDQRRAFIFCDDMVLAFQAG